jgi:hypothetical protein
MNVHREGNLLSPALSSGESQVRMTSSSSLILFAFGRFDSSRKKAHQNSLGLLFYVEDASEVGLGGFQLGLFFFPGGAEFGERVFDLRSGRVVFNGLLQRLLFLAGRGAKARPTAGAARTSWRTARTARSTWPSPRTTRTAHEHAAAHIGLPARFHHFLDQRLNGRPFSVIGDAEVCSDVVHHALTELGGVEIASRTAGATRTTGTAAIVILGKQPSAAKAQDCDHPQNS